MKQKYMRHTRFSNEFFFVDREEVLGRWRLFVKRGGTLNIIDYSLEDADPPCSAIFGIILVLTIN